MTTSSRTFEKQNSRNKKIVAAIFAAIMVISVLSILSVGTQPSFAASGSVNYDPVVFSHSSSSTIVLSNGGSFASGSTVKFYASSSTSFSSSDTVIGEEPVNVSPESSEAATYQDPVVRELVLNVTCAFDNVVPPPVRV